MSIRFGSVFLDPTKPNNTELNLRYSVNSVLFGRTLCMMLLAMAGHVVLGSTKIIHEIEIGFLWQSSQLT